MEIESPQQGNEELSEKKKKGGGSFRITRQSLEILMECQATAWQIAVYLTLARHTDVTGKFSTAGYKKLYKATTASPGTTGQQRGTGPRLVAELMNMEMEGDKGPRRLLYTPDEWHEITGEEIPNTNHKLFQVKFVLNDFDSEDWIWFCNELVDGYGKFKQPMKKLKQCGNIAARLLLVAYSVNNMMEFGGIEPSTGFFNYYPVYEHSHLVGGFTFFTSVESKKEISNYVIWQVMRVHASDSETQKAALLNALVSLVCQGFLYEVVQVLDRHPHDPDARPMYELHNKAAKVNKGEEGLVRRIDRIVSKALGHSKVYYIGDSTGRYQKKLPLISRSGVLPFVAGIYRPRLRVNNPRNFSVQETWRRIENNRWEWGQDLDSLEKLYNLEPFDEMLQKQAVESKRIETLLNLETAIEPVNVQNDDVFDEIF